MSKFYQVQLKSLITTCILIQIFFLTWFSSSSLKIYIQYIFLSYASSFLSSLMYTENKSIFTLFVCLIFIYVEKISFATRSLICLLLLKVQLDFIVLYFVCQSQPHNSSIYMLWRNLARLFRKCFREQKDKIPLLPLPTSFYA